MKFNLKQTYLKLPSIFHNKTLATTVRQPKGLLFNYKLAKELNLVSNEKIYDDQVFPNEFLPYFSGNESFPDIPSLAQAYAGHQFGHFNMLGDGRTILLAEGMNSDGKAYDLQLKGSGRTIYSRGGDGRAALGPMLREYLISEAMYYLGVPTSRSLAVVQTGESVFRESELKGAILTRIAASHIRVGTFEFAAAFGKFEDLKALADYSIQRHYPEAEKNSDKYLIFLRKVCEKQAKLISLWMKYGFIHGVMNTDNMFISGETLDYGPCAFMEKFAHQRFFSSIDRRGRYAYENQPAIAEWNLTRLAETLLPLISSDEQTAIGLAKNELISFKENFDNLWLNQFRLKIGLILEKPEDKELIQDFLNLLEKNELDFTNAFLFLSDSLAMPEMKSVEFLDWKRRWNERLKLENRLEKEIQSSMLLHNPFVIPRNQNVEDVLLKANEGDLNPYLQFLNVLREPFSHKHDIQYLKPSTNQMTYKTFCGT